MTTTCQASSDGQIAPGHLGQPAEGKVYRRGIVQVQFHPAGLGFVNQAGRREFEDHREPQAAGSVHRPFRGGGRRPGGQREAQGLDQ